MYTQAHMHKYTCIYTYMKIKVFKLKRAKTFVHTCIYVHVYVYIITNYRAPGWHNG